MRKRTRYTVTAAIAAAALTLTACADSDGNGTSNGNGGSDEAPADSGESISLTMATMVQPTTPNAPVQDWFLDQLEERSDGRISIERSEPETICDATEVAECVRDGRADIGISISDYTPQLFPTMTVATIPFMAENSQAFMQALYKVNTEHESAVQLWDQAGIEYIAAWGPGKLILGSNAPMDSISEVAGERMRVTGFYLQQAFDMVGSNVVALPAAETYEAIERGLADAVAWTLDGPVDYRLMEQLTTWTDPGVGHYTTFAIWLNKSVYDSMPDDLRAIVDEVRDELNHGAGMEAFNSRTELQCDALLEFPNTESLSAWDESATEEWKSEVQDDLIEQWITQAEEDGVTDAAEFLDAYRSALDEADAEGSVQDPVEICIERFESQ